MQYWLRPSTADDFEFVFQVNNTNMRSLALAAARAQESTAERLPSAAAVPP